MRLAHVDTGTTWRGGQAQVLLLITGLARRGHDVELFAPPGSPLADRALASGIAVTCLPLRGAWDLRSCARLAARWRHRRPDVVHAHTAHAVTLAGIAGRLARVSLIVAARRVDFPLSRLGRHKLRWLSDLVIAVSDGVREVLVRGRVPPGRIVVVRSGIDLAAAAGGRAPRESTRAALGIGMAPLVGATGALVDHKDHATLIAAAARIHERRHDVRFVLAGSGPLEAELRALARRHGLERVFHFLGFRGDLPDLHRALDVYVLSSHLEGLGTSVLEAMAAGTVVVATRTGGVPEMVEDGRTGVLVPPRDPQAMAAAILDLIHDRARADALADAARHEVGERFSAERMVDETLAAYRSRLRPAPATPA